MLGCLLAMGLGVQAEGAKKLLVVTVTKGFRHSSIPVAEKVLGQLAQSSGVFTVDYARNDEELAAKTTPAALAGYDGFIFANTTGILPLADKAAFLDAIKGGKAFIGMHSCSDTFHGAEGTVDPFIQMLGGEFQGHGSQVGVECLSQDLKHPAVKHFGESFCLEKEEIYLLKNYDSKRVHELLVLDKHPNKKTQLGRFPIAWNREHGTGKVFYTSLGHREDVWENKSYQTHLLGGIKWALGLEAGEVAPQAK